MKRLPYILLFLLVCRLTYAAAPSRTKTYTAGETILSSDVTENEDNIYNYLQAGVDTYAALSINNADVSASANIQSDKLNLTSIVQGVAITSSGSLTNAGTTTLSGTVGISGALTVTGNSTFAGTTIVDLGTVTTGIMTAISIQSGSIEDTDVGLSTRGNGYFDNVRVGTTNQGDIFYDDGTNLARLTPGTSGQYFQTQGDDANPQWADVNIGWTLTQVITVNADTEDITIAANKTYKIIANITADGQESSPSILFGDSGGIDTGASDYAYSLNGVKMDTTPTEVRKGDNAHEKIFITVNALDPSIAIHFELTVQTTKIATDSAFVDGSCSYLNADATYESVDVRGVYLVDTTITQMRFDLSGAGAAPSGTILVYELDRSL